MRKQKKIHARPFGFLSIQCEKCCASSGLTFAPERAIKAWNRRYTPSEIDFDYGAED